MGKDDSAILIEYFEDKFDKFLEGVESVIDRNVRIIVREELEPVKNDIKTIKAVYTETNQDIQNLKIRVADLEAA